MKSEVERNQKLVRIGDILVYADANNCETFQVLDLFEGGFTAKSNYETKDFYFSELQQGWCFSNLTKTQNSTNFRLHYV